MRKFTLLEIADAVEKFDRGENVDRLDNFDMNTWWNWYHPSSTDGLEYEEYLELGVEDQNLCHSAGCIAGTVVALAIEEGIEIEDFTDIEELALNLIDSPYKSALRKLFLGNRVDWMPEYAGRTLVSLTPKDAAKSIRKLHYYLLDFES